MRLRTYLIRRAIHTVITLLVVLVLLFVIFRLMPGDPSRFFIAPGQPRQVQDEICVSFGLCKWVSAPGHGYESQIQAGDSGPYNITAWVNDTAGNRGKYGFVHNNLGFAVNNPVSGFDLVEDKFYGVRPGFPPDRALISVNVTSRSAGIYNVTANSRSPFGFVQIDIRLRHPLEAVRRNLGEQF